MSVCEGCGAVKREDGGGVLCVRLGPGTRDTVLPECGLAFDSRRSSETCEGGAPVKVWGSVTGDSSSKFGSEALLVILSVTFALLDLSFICSTIALVAVKVPKVEKVGEPSGWRAVEFTYTGYLYMYCKYSIHAHVNKYTHMHSNAYHLQVLVACTHVFVTSHVQAPT